MNLQNRSAVVTGGGSGIGRALCLRFAREGVRALIVADLDAEAARRVAAECGGIATRCDVSDEADIRSLAAFAEKRFGAIDLFCSNAGIAVPGGPETPDADWDRSWKVNVMAHVWAARAVVPKMLERGAGYLLQTVSAAGLLTNLFAAPYSVTKHAALGFAEWLSITYGDRGLRVSALCPMGVRTPMLDAAKGQMPFLEQGAIEPDTVAETVIQGLADERFLILPHPEVQRYFQNKALDYERWLAGMRRLQADTAAPAQHGGAA